MKTQNILILIALLIAITNCKKNETDILETGINFCIDEKVSDIIVKYDEIIGYDATKHIFQVTEFAWNKLNNEIQPSEPDPNFKFGVTLNNQIIYTAKYIPGYNSWSNFETITFSLGVPDLVYIRLGYPGFTPEVFAGEDSRNDQRLIDQLKKDNKLLEIED